MLKKISSLILVTFALATASSAVQINGQLEKAGLERLSSDPTGTFEGRIYENTVSHLPKFYNGSAWRTLAPTDSPTFTGTITGTLSGNASTATTLTGVLSKALGGTNQDNSSLTFPTTGTVPAYTPTNHGVVISGSGAAAAVTTAGTAGHVLTSNGASADPTFQAPSSGSGARWSGTHGTDCVFPRTSSSFGDFTADSTCTFTTLHSVNMTVTSYLSGSDKLPGITFTPPTIGGYMVCVSGAWSGTTSGSNYNIRLYDGTDQLAITSMDIPTGGNTYSYSMCGITHVGSIATVTVRLEGKGQSNTVTTSSVDKIYWSVARVDTGI